MPDNPKVGEVVVEIIARLDKLEAGMRRAEAVVTESAKTMRKALTLGTVVSFAGVLTSALKVAAVIARLGTVATKALKGDIGGAIDDLDAAMQATFPGLHRAFGETQSAVMELAHAFGILSDETLKYQSLSDPTVVQGIADRNAALRAQASAISDLLKLEEARLAMMEAQSATAKARSAYEYDRLKNLRGLIHGYQEIDGVLRPLFVSSGAKRLFDVRQAISKLLRQQKQADAPEALSTSVQTATGAYKVAQPRAGMRELERSNKAQEKSAEKQVSLLQRISNDIHVMRQSSAFAGAFT